MKTRTAFHGGLSALLAAASVAAATELPSPISLFTGRDLTGWKLVGGKGTNQWRIAKAELDPAAPQRLVAEGAAEELVSPFSGANLATTGSYGDCHFECEFMVAKNSNSGVKLMNIYEIQLLDSHAKAKPGKSDCGAVYDEVAPRVNACKPAGEWQSLVIDFRAPRFDAQGRKTANACFVKVLLNGQVIQENVSLERGTGAGGRVAKEQALAPVYLQGDHGPVAFRHLTLTPRVDPEKQP